VIKAHEGCIEAEAAAKQRAEEPTARKEQGADRVAPKAKNATVRKAKDEGRIDEAVPNKMPMKAEDAIGRRGPEKRIESKEVKATLETVVEYYAPESK
jgi:hypothetical protein